MHRPIPPSRRPRVPDSTARPPIPPLSLALVNTLAEDAFVAAFSGIFEHSPWVARTAWRRNPFRSLADVHLAFEEAVRNAGAERQLALIRAHPELAARVALSDASGREQAAAGLDRLDEHEAERWRALNRRYRERFGFPFVVCVGEHTKESILRVAGERLAHTRDEEVRVALEEIAKIARLRLEALA